MGGLLDLIDEEMSKPKEEEKITLYSLGEIKEAADADRIEVAVHGGKRYMTIVCDNGKYSLRPTTAEEYAQLKERRGR